MYFAMPTLRARRAGAPPPLLVGAADDVDVVDEMAELVEVERLRPVAQRRVGVGMEIDEDHVGAGDHPLRRDMEDIEEAVRAHAAPADGVRRVDADRQAREPVYDRDVSD